MYLLCIGYEFSPALFCSGHLDAHKSACVAQKVTWTDNTSSRLVPGRQNGAGCTRASCWVSDQNDRYRAVTRGCPSLVSFSLPSLAWTVCERNPIASNVTEKIRMHVSTHPCLSQLAIWNSVMLVYSSLSSLSPSSFLPSGTGMLGGGTDAGHQSLCQSFKVDQDWGRGLVLSSQWQDATTLFHTVTGKERGPKICSLVFLA